MSIAETIDIETIADIERILPREFDTTEPGVVEAITAVVKAAEGGQREIYSDFLGVWVKLAGA
jgi:hypothetical protein